MIINISVLKKIAACAFALTIAFSCLSCIFVASAAGVVNNGDGATNATSLIFSPQGSGVIYYTVGTRTSRAQNKYTATSVPIGTEVSLRAEERNNAQFVYWFNLYTDRVVSYEKVITFTLSAKTQLYAAFITPLEGYHYVAYLNYAGSILYSGDVKLGDSVIPPIDTALPGFTFLGWDHTPMEVYESTETVIVRAQYSLNEENHVIDFTNTQNVYGAGTYNVYDTVSIRADEKNSAGEAFSYWKTSDDKIVSYSSSYTFRVNYSETFTAVYGETVTPEPISRLSNIVIDGSNRRITFFSERSIPDGYKLLQNGVLITSSSTTPLIVSNVALGDSALVKKGTAVSNESCGTYSLTKINAVAGTVYRARSYAICENSAGEQYIFYGEIETASY